MNTKSNTASIAFAEIARLALQIHQAGEREFRIDLPADSILHTAELPQGCRLAKDTLEFSSLRERNTIVAEATFEGLRSQWGIDSHMLVSSI